MDEIVSVTPRGLDRALQEGLAHFDEERFEEALAVFEGAIGRLGPNMDLYHWKGVTLRQLGRLREAIDALETSAAAASPAGSVYELAVLLLEEDVDSERGAALLDGLSAAGDLPAREYLTHRAYEEGRFADVVTLARAPKDAEQQKQWPDAVECLETLEGIALTELGRLDEARFHLKRAAKNSPGCPSHMTNLGRIYQLEKRYARALKCYMQACEVDPDDPVPRANLAHLHEEMGRLEQAETLFKGLYHGHPGETMMMEDYARFLTRHGRLDEAIQLVERALQDAPEGEPVDDMAAFVGWLAMDAGDRERARAIWEAQVKTKPKAFAARHYLSGLMALEGDSERALTLLESAQELDPVAARNWCNKPGGGIEDCFVSLAENPRFQEIAGHTEPNG